MLTNTFMVDDIIEEIISFCKRMGLVDNYASYSFFTQYRKESITKVFDYYRCLVNRFGDLDDKKHFEFVAERV